MAAEIAMAESGGRQYALSPTNDYGYWQINGSHGPAGGHLQPDRQRQGRDRHLRRRDRLGPVDHLRHRRLRGPLLTRLAGDPAGPLCSSAGPFMFDGMDTPDVLAWQDGHIEALDQTALPHQVPVLRLTTVDQLVDAITRLAVRGAPLLGAAGALGVALAVRQGEREGWDAGQLDAEVKRIADARPTAVNLRREVLAVAAVHSAGPPARGGRRPRGSRYRDRGQQAPERAGRRVPHRGVRGRAAEGTHALQHRRPRLPGLGERARRDPGAAGPGCPRARHRGRDPAAAAGIAAHRLGTGPARHRALPRGRRRGTVPDRQGQADAVVVGADRVAANGDVANKIGTYSLALAAHRAGIPFVVAAPESTIDEATASRGGDPARAAGGRGGLVPAAPAGDPRAELRLRHHSGRARHGCSHGEEADNEGRSKLNWLWVSANPQAR